jgi:hypothetical protein
MQKIQLNQIAELKETLSELTNKINALEANTGNNNNEVDLSRLIIKKQIISSEKVDINTKIISLDEITGSSYQIYSLLFFVNGLKQEENTYTIELDENTNTYKIICNFDIEIDWVYSVAYISNLEIIYNFDFGGNDVSDPNKVGIQSIGIIDLSDIFPDIPEMPRTDFSNEAGYLIKDFTTETGQEENRPGYSDYLGDHTHMNDLTKGYFGIYALSAYFENTPTMLFFDRIPKIDIGNYELSFWIENIIKSVNIYQYGEPTIEVTIIGLIYNEDDESFNEEPLAVKEFVKIKNNDWRKLTIPYNITKKMDIVVFMITYKTGAYVDTPSISNSGLIALDDIQIVKI